VGLLRRGGRPDPETAQGTHLVPARDHTRGVRFGQGFRTGLDRGPGVLPARRRASPPRLIYRTRTHRGRKGERRSFSERDYADLLDAAHQQLGGPIAAVWDNLNTHISRAMREFIAARDWLRVYRLPAYAPELNGAEGVWCAARKQGRGADLLSLAAEESVGLGVSRGASHAGVHDHEVRSRRGDHRCAP
jgi:hypothetical protein